MFRIGESIVDETILPSSIATPTYNPYYPYRVDLKSSNNVLLRTYYVGAEDCVISRINYEISKKGLLTCKVKFERIDIPINFSDIVEIYYNGVREFSGFVEEKPEKEGDVKITPFIKRLDDALYSGSFVDKTRFEILETVLNDKQDITLCFYNESKLNFLDTETYSVNYKRESLKKILKDWLGTIEDVEWGLDANRFINANDDDDFVSHNLRVGEYPDYEEVEVENNIEQIKATFYYIFQEDGSGNASLIGTVPDGGDYPYLELETEIGRRIEKKITAPEDLSVTQSKDWAYNKLLNQNKEQKVKVKGIDRRVFDIYPYEKITVEDKPELRLTLEEECESLDGWSGEISLVEDGYSSIYAIGLNCEENNNQYALFDFGRTKKFKEIRKIVFFVKSSEIINDALSVHLIQESRMAGYGVAGVGSYEDGSEEHLGSFNVRTVGVYTMIEIETNTDDFRWIMFNNISSTETTILIDQIYIQYYSKKIYEGVVNKVKRKIEKDNFNFYDIEIGTEIKTLNRLTFDLDERMAAIEAYLEE